MWSRSCETLIIGVGPPARCCKTAAARSQAQVCQHPSATRVPFHLSPWWNIDPYVEGVRPAMRVADVNLRP